MTERIDLVTVGSLFVEITPSTPGEQLSSAHHYTLVAGGAAANVVFALAKLGVNVNFITAVGDDDFGTFLENELISFGISTSGVRRIPQQLTPVSFCAVDLQGGKQFSFYRFPGWCSPMEKLTADDFSAVRACRLFDFSEGSIREAVLRPQVFAGAREARQHGASVLYAVNLRKRSWRLPDDEIRAIEREAITLADIIILNEEEVNFITGQAGEVGMDHIRALGPQVVVMTRGGDGDILVKANEKTAAVPPYQVPVIYDVGAGDTFSAGLVAAVLQHDIPTMSFADWVDAACFGAATAAIRVSTSADPHDLPSYNQVRAWMEQK
ncbi:MAG TPA: PfkB family carbohydrate kinase [Armatimonadota bacterium]|nr:PfkB family carbohydrate kinase [Armatimonadota bacterium]